VPGSNTWTVYCNDTWGNNGKEDITFIRNITTPNVNILYPENTTYNTNVSELNYTTNADDSCWYSINGGVSNSTPIAAGTNFTNVISVEGSNTWTLWCNNSAGFTGMDSVIFEKETVVPSVNIVYPESTTYYENVTELNYTVGGTDVCWYSTDGGLTNSSPQTPGQNWSGLTAGEGSNTWQVWCNNTAGDGTDIVIFTQNTSGAPPSGEGNGTGYVNVSITTTLAIEVIQEDVDFGEGAVDSGESNAELYTNQDNAPTQNRGNWTLPNAYAIEVRNTGNINCSLDISSSKTAGSFIGGTNPEYQWKVSDKEAGSCSGGLTAGSWYDVNSSARLCQHLSPINASDEIFLDIRLVVPYDANLGSGSVHKTDILTLTASAVA
jgi:hypothetical protein